MTKTKTYTVNIYETEVERKDLIHAALIEEGDGELLVKLLDAKTEDEMNAVFAEFAENYEEPIERTVYGKIEDDGYRKTAYGYLSSGYDWLYWANTESYIPEYDKEYYNNEDLIAETMTKKIIDNLPTNIRWANDSYIAEDENCCAMGVVE